MDKREFLKTSGVLFAGTLFSKLTSAQTAAGSRTNWAGNYAYNAKTLTWQIVPKTSGTASLVTLISRLSERVTRSMALPTAQKSRYR
jgi:hypothetical protein